jgi:hypothetical protein
LAPLAHNDALSLSDIGFQSSISAHWSKTLGVLGDFLREKARLCGHNHAEGFGEKEGKTSAPDHQSLSSA